MAQDNGYSMFHYAALSYFEDQTKLLLTSGVTTFNDRDALGRNPLHIVQLPETAKLLLAAGTSPIAEDNDGRTPLFYATDVEVAKLLVKVSSVDHKDRNGRTPLFCALTDEVAQLLIDEGADINIEDNDGRTARDFAKTYERAKMLSYNENDENAKGIKMIINRKIIEELKGTGMHLQGFVPGTISVQDIRRNDDYEVELFDRPIVGINKVWKKDMFAYYKKFNQTRT